LRVVHAVPNTLEDGGERCNTNTGTAKYCNFELEHVLRCGTERSVNVDTGQNLAQSNLLARYALVSLFTGCLLLRAAAEGLSKSSGEVADHTDVNRDVVFLGCASKREGVVLPDGDFRAAQENVLDLLAENNVAKVDCTYLSSTGRGVLLLDLNLTNVARVLDDLGDVRLVASSDLTRDTLSQVRESTVHPVLPEDTDTIAERCKIRLDHAKGSMD
jgi:hypothetical protein